MTDGTVFRTRFQTVRHIHQRQRRAANDNPRRALQMRVVRFFPRDSAPPLALETNPSPTYRYVFPFIRMNG
ncbi:MAG: hypothetical protein KF684_05455 [Phycisphaeraceae bacterium]|nr:hypothetical protein [Phycisphaeraceae bacterium]